MTHINVTCQKKCTHQYILVIFVQYAKQNNSTSVTILLKCSALGRKQGKWQRARIYINQATLIRTFNC